MRDTEPPTEGDPPSIGHGEGADPPERVGESATTSESGAGASAPPSAGQLSDALARLAACDPADAPVIADQIAAALAGRLEPAPTREPSD